jgi:hypothetical protein
MRCDGINIPSSSIMLAAKKAGREGWIVKGSIVKGSIVKG